jgi:hypothetical protein
MPVVFRPLLRHWISRLILPAALVVWAGYLAVYHLFGGSAMVLAWAAVVILLNRPPVWQRELRFDAQGFSARLGKETCRMLWQDILVARQFERAGRDYLELSSEQVTKIIPLEFFDGHTIWERVRRYASPEALDGGAYKRTPAYQEWLTKTKPLLSDIREPLRAGYPTWQSFLVVVISLAVIWLVCRVALLTLGLIGAIFCFGLLLLLIGKLITLMFLYRVEMTSEAVTVFDLWKQQVMRWDEVEYIEHSSGWDRFVMVGHDKRLAVIGPRCLAGKDRVQMSTMLRAQVEHRHIELRHRERALFTWSRNVAAGRSA